jgi:hypothetical protein
MLIFWREKGEENDSKKSEILMWIFQYGSYRQPNGNSIWTSGKSRVGSPGFGRLCEVPPGCAGIHSQQRR